MKNLVKSVRLVGLFVVGIFVSTLLFTDMLRIKQTDAAVLGLPEPIALLKPSRSYEMPLLRGLRIDHTKSIEHIFYC